MHFFRELFAAPEQVVARSARAILVADALHALPVELTARVAHVGALHVAHALHAHTVCVAMRA